MYICTVSVFVPGCMFKKVFLFAKKLEKLVFTVIPSRWNSCLKVPNHSNYQRLHTALKAQFIGPSIVYKAYSLVRNHRSRVDLVLFFPQRLQWLAGHVTMCILTVAYIQLGSFYASLHTEVLLRRFTFRHLLKYMNVNSFVSDYIHMYIQSKRNTS